MHPNDPHLENTCHNCWTAILMYREKPIHKEHASRSLHPISLPNPREVVIMSVQPWPAYLLYRSPHRVTSLCTWPVAISDTVTTNITRNPRKRSVFLPGMHYLPLHGRVPSILMPRPKHSSHGVRMALLRSSNQIHEIWCGSMEDCRESKRFRLCGGYRIVPKPLLSLIFRIRGSNDTSCH